MTNDPIEVPGTLVSHCTEEDGPADVGLSLTLPGGAVLWAGEITRDAWEAEGEDAAALGDDCGTWLILYDGAARREVIGKATTREAGFALVHAVVDALRGSVDKADAWDGARASFDRARRAAERERWYRAEDYPEEYEGRVAWEFYEGRGYITQAFVHKGYSRDPHHCGGIWFMRLCRPEPPTLDNIESRR